MSDDENRRLVLNNPMLTYANPLIQRRKQLTFYQSLKLGPLQKFLVHGIFPWKLIICILIIICTIIQSVLIISRITHLSRAQIRSLYNLFIEENDKTDIDYSKTVYLYTIEDLKNHLRFSINVN